MKALEKPTQMIIQLGEFVRPKTGLEKRARVTWAVIMLGGLAALYYYLYLA